MPPAGNPELRKLMPSYTKPLSEDEQNFSTRKKCFLLYFRLNNCHISSVALETESCAHQPCLEEAKVWKMSHKLLSLSPRQRHFSTLVGINRPQQSGTEDVFHCHVERKTHQR